MKTHHLPSTEGKFFIGFTAQILLAHILNQLGKVQKPPVPTVRALIIELDKLYRIENSDGSVRMNTMTRKQKDILKLFSIEQGDFVRQLCRP